MGTQTAIEWTDHTFNPWRGCSKVSPGCDHCYAARYGKRQPETFGTWGPNGKRVIAAESAWRKPLAWNRAAERAGVRRRVFCGSLMDVFEDRELPRARLFDVIESTPHLDWLLLTKRPENVDRIMRQLVYDADPAAPRAWKFPPNVWLGATVENAGYLGRIDWLKSCGASVLFLSYEPALGPVDISQYLWVEDSRDYGHPGRNGIDWVIAGGESGPGARPAHPDWFRSVRDQCQAAGVPFFFKGWGEWVSLSAAGLTDLIPGNYASSLFSERPYHDEPVVLHRVGKKHAGRLLDGRTWDEVPEEVSQ